MNSKTLLEATYRTAGLLMGPLSISTDVNLPFSVASDIRLDTATAEERQHLKPAFDRTYAHLTPSVPPSKLAFESDWVVSPNDAGFETESIDLEPGQHRYFVLRTGGTAMQPQAQRLDDLDLVLQLRSPCLKVTVEYFTGPPGGIGSGIKSGPRSSVSFITETITASGVQTVLRSELSAISCDLQLMDELDAERHIRILRALEMMRDASEVRQSNALHLLGYFVALECLLTHRPSPGDPADSIGRQLRRSIPLLLKRAGKLAEFEQSLPVTTLITKLYELRSALAHGSPVGTALPQALAPYGNFGDVVDVTRSILQVVLRQSLVEPDLVVDLCGDW